MKLFWFILLLMWSLTVYGQNEGEPNIIIEDDEKVVYKQPKKDTIPLLKHYDSKGDAVAMGIVKPIIDGKKTVAPSKNIMNQAFKGTWNNVLVVADWTGSMYEYTPQVLKWHLDNRRTVKVKHLVLFNDGDKTPDANKRVGQTGGIHIVNNPSSEKNVLETIKKVVNLGDGGDGQENDLEAVIYGIQRFSTRAMSFHPKVKKHKKGRADFDKVVLIADGNSSVRDISLLWKVKYPIHTIMCQGTRAASDYLEIAYQTKGSVATINSKVDFSSSRRTSVTFSGKTYTRQSSGKWK